MTLWELMKTADPPLRKGAFDGEIVPIYDERMGLIVNFCFQWHSVISDWAIVESDTALEYKGSQ